MSNQTKKQSVINRIKNTNFNFVANFKNYLFTSLAIILLAVIVVIFFGFNASFSMQKGHTFNIGFGTEINAEQQDDVFKIVKKSLNDKKIKKFDIKTEGSDHTKIVVVNVYGKHKALLNEDSWESISDNIENQISSEHTFGALKVSEVQTTSPLFGFSQMLTPLLAILIITAVYVVLSLIRYDISTMLSLIAGGVHDILLFLALAAILRVQVSPLIGLLAVVVYLYSITINSLTFNSIKNGFLNQQFEKQTNVNILQNVLKSGVKGKVIITGLLLLSGVLLTAIGTNPALSLGLSIILTGLVVGYSSFVITPSIWALTYNRANDKRLTKSLAKKLSKNKEEEEKLVV